MRQFRQALQMLPSLSILVAVLFVDLIFELMPKGEEIFHRNFGHAMARFHQSKLFTHPRPVVIGSQSSV
jgi:hypothetical protein